MQEEPKAPLTNPLNNPLLPHRIEFKLISPLLDLSLAILIGGLLADPETPLLEDETGPRNTETGLWSRFNEAPLNLLPEYRNELLNSFNSSPLSCHREPNSSPPPEKLDDDDDACFTVCDENRHDSPPATGFCDAEGVDAVDDEDRELNSKSCEACALIWHGCAVEHTLLGGLAYRAIVGTVMASFLRRFRTPNHKSRKPR